MSRVVDVMSNPKDGVQNLVESSNASNQVQRTFDGAAKSGLRFVVKPPLTGNNKDEEQQMNDDVHKGIQAAKWVGVMVTKEFDGRRYMGEVMNYHAETGVYKINYENQVSEEVYYHELQQIVAPPVLVRDYVERFGPSDEGKGKKKRHLYDTNAPIHPRRYAPPAPPVQPEPKKRKPRKPPTPPSEYVPLAVREKKRDEYFYY